jgi:hypothetical protein
MVSSGHAFHFQGWDSGSQPSAFAVAPLEASLSLPLFPVYGLAGAVDGSKGGDGDCEDLPFPFAYVGDKKVERFHFSEIIGRLPYVRATVTGTLLGTVLMEGCSAGCRGLARCPLDYCTHPLAA